MQALGAVMENINDFQTTLASLLIQLGKNHLTIKNFDPRYFNAFEEAILEIWSEDLGTKFTDECREAWINVLKFIQNQLKKGYNIALQETVEKQTQNIVHRK